MRHVVYDFLISKGLSESTSTFLNMLVLLIGLLLAAFIIDFITKRILWRISESIAKRTKTNFDDILISNKLPRNIAHIIPLIILIEFVPDVFADYMESEIIIEKTLKIIAVLLTLRIAKSFLNSIRDYCKTIDSLKDKPIDSYIQVFMIFGWLLGIFIIFAIATGISFFKFITTLGAASAIIILVFRDTILGFVASIQVTINDMVRIGDWISFEKYGADGDVIEINLATVKVQNWDKTITTIPTYALISDSFKNWRGMMESGGRRIKRAVIIKTSSIHFLSEHNISEMKKIQLISEYLKLKEEEISKYNEEAQIDTSIPINGRNLTNFGVFRKYLLTYIENHSAVNKDMTLMVRQLEPTPQGIPMEIYAFSSDIRWKNYEFIMGDIFDHVLASVKYFDLEIYELGISV